MGRLTGRLIAWGAVVAFLTVIAYAAYFSGARPDKNVAYRWDTSILALVQYAIILGVALLITRGLDRRQFLALRRPSSWGRAVGISLGVLFLVLITGTVVSALGNAEKEQGLIPEHWESSKLAPFLAYVAVVVVVAPIVEETMFRGVGYGLLEPFGQTLAIVVVGLAFALIHGLVIGFAVIAVFGTGLAYLRARTGSIYPCMLLHASFNAFGLAYGITHGG